MRSPNLVLRFSWLISAVVPGVVWAAEQPVPTDTATEKGATLAPREIEGVKVGKRLLVGETAPDFEISAEFGGPLRLSSFRGKKDVILVFYRAHW